MLVKNFGLVDKWLPGVVVSILGEVNYRVLLSDGRIWHRHVDQMVKRYPVSDMEQSTVEAAVIRDTVPSSEFDFVPEVPLVSSRTMTPRIPAIPETTVEFGPTVVRQDATPVVAAGNSTAATSSSSGNPVLTEPRRSNRVRDRPAYLKDYVST